MCPYKVSAQFAAFVWFQHNASRKAKPEEAREFARKNWALFLPEAQEGLGKLLLRIAGTRSRSHSRRARQNRRPRSAMARAKSA